LFTKRTAPSLPDYWAITHFEKNFDYSFWSRKYEIYDIKIIPFHLYSKELSNDSSIYLILC
jgi:hypothetical protein